jgi:cytochrome P450
VVAADAQAVQLKEADMTDDAAAAGAAGCPIDFSLADPAVLEHPLEFYGRLRRDDPVHYDARLNSYVVSRYEDVMTVLRDAETYSQELGWKQQFGAGHFDELKAILERDGGGYFPEVLLLDPPGHTRIRKLLGDALGSRRVEQLKPRILRLIRERVDRLAERGEADGVHDFAMPLTIDIMCEQLGFPRAEAAARVPLWARAYIDQVSAPQTREQLHANAALICELQHFIIDRVREREHEKREDMITDLIYAVIEDDESTRLSFAETVALTRGLLLAGNDTTTMAITSFLLLIATRPDIAARVRGILDGNRQLSRFVEELLRLKPPVRGLFRYATRDVQLGGTTIPAGGQVYVLFASANDDEAVFACPRDFDMDRANVTRHLAFGAGIHLCAGIALARMEIKAVIVELMSRLTDFELAVPADTLRYAPSLTSMPLESLPLRFRRIDGGGR